MTIIGEADLDIVPVTSGFSGRLSQQLQRVAGSTGQVFGRQLGQKSSESFAHEMERGTAGLARSGRMFAGVFTSNSAQALGPLQEVADKVELIGRALDTSRTKAGGALLGIGAAVTGIGAFLSTLDSRERGSIQRLGASIAATGHDIGSYREEIEKAVKSGEHFGYQGNQTIDALNTLTIGLHDPEKALRNLSLAQDVAAAKGMSLANAADIVRQVYNGSPRALRQFGISADQLTDVTKKLDDAQKGVAGSAKAQTDAQKAYNEKLAIYRDTLHPTLSQQLALKDSSDKLAVANANLSAAQGELKTANEAVTSQLAIGDQKLAAVADRVRGQASASADTFTGKLKALGAVVEDNGAKLGGKFGHALIIIGPALAGIGFIIESGLIPKIASGVLGFLGLGTTAAATATAIEAENVAEVASFQTVVAAIGELQFALTGIAPAMAEATAAVEAGAAAQTTALEGEAAAASGLKGILATLGGGAALGIIGAGIGVAIKEAVDTNSLTGSLAQQVKALKDAEAAAKGDDLKAAIDAATKRAEQLGVTRDKAGNFLLLTTDAKHANQRSAAEQILNDVKAAQDALMTAEQKGLLDDATAERNAQRHGGAIATGITKGINAGKPETLAQYLARMGLGPVADAKAQAEATKALQGAQKAAADHARAIGTEVTNAIRAQVAIVKKEIGALDKERTKILDFRTSVLTAAGSFTDLTSLLTDPSTATAGTINKALDDRLLGLQTFAKNLRILAQRHLDPGVIAELAKAGPQDRALSSALVNATPEQLAALNAAEKAVRQQAQVLAKTAVDAEFGDRPAQVDKRLAQLNSQLAMLNKQMAAQPALIAKAVDAARKNATVATKTSTRTAVPR